MTVKLKQFAALSVALLTFAITCGCSLFPETRQRDRIHNPFPQFKRIAVLPFFNQSSDPTVDSDLVAEKYYAALQSVPGFEVLPIGVAKAQWLQYALANGEPTTGEQFQQLARQMGVEAIVVGSVTDFQTYYPPRLAMTVHWYAANEGFHPIPAGYGLPWGTESETHIPKRIAREAEFELARSQLATQSPEPGMPPFPLKESLRGEAPPTTQDNRFDPRAQTDPTTGVLSRASGEMSLSPPQHLPPQPPQPPQHEGSTTDPFAEPVLEATAVTAQFHDGVLGPGEFEPPLPADWPDPTDLIPDPPSPVRPVVIPNHAPVLSHTKLYQGDDPYFTNRLADHVETGDDARPGGWQGYLKRSDDFIRFCCHLHITEMLESRGGSEQSDLILRWPLSRY